MALNIKDPEADRLARALAAATGESITVAARAAFAERLARVQARDTAPEVLAELESIIARARERETLDLQATISLNTKTGNGVCVGTTKVL